MIRTLAVIGGIAAGLSASSARADAWKTPDENLRCLSALILALGMTEQEAGKVGADAAGAIDKGITFYSGVLYGADASVNWYARARAYAGEHLSEPGVDVALVAASCAQDAGDRILHDVHELQGELSKKPS